jgi:hypothetical protein
MHKSLMFAVLAMGGLSLVSAPANAQFWGGGGGVNPTYLASVTGASLSSYQTSTIPLSYSFCSKTYLAASDTTSATFQALEPTYMSYILSNLKEGVAFTGAGLNQLDPERLYFSFAYAPRCYFIYGYAAFIDGFGVTIGNVAPPTESEPVGTNLTCMSDVHWNGSTSRSSTYPVLPGDFIQLPTVNAGQQLAFMCYSNENSNGAPANVWYNGASNNSDGFQHMIAFFPDNSQYIIIGFEDYPGGGDQDCNDVMFVVDIGANNAAALRSTSSMPK